jgi:hypothetical protein
MISREELSRAAPNVNSATIRYVRGDINRKEYEKLVKREREQDRRPAAEQSATTTDETPHR